MVIEMDCGAKVIENCSNKKTQQAAAFCYKNPNQSLYVVYQLF